MLQIVTGTSLWLCSGSGTAINKPERILHRIDNPWDWQEQSWRNDAEQPYATTACGDRITVVPIIGRTRRCGHCSRESIKPPTPEAITVTQVELADLLNWIVRDLEDRSWFKSDPVRVVGEVHPAARHWRPPVLASATKPAPDPGIQRSLGLI